MIFFRIIPSDPLFLISLFSSLFALSHYLFWCLSFNSLLVVLLGQNIGNSCKEKELVVVDER